MVLFPNFGWRSFITTPLSLLMLRCQKAPSCSSGAAQWHRLYWAASRWTGCSWKRQHWPLGGVTPNNIKWSNEEVNWPSSSSSLTCGRCDNRHIIGVLAVSTPAANTDILTVRAVSPSPDPVWTVQQGGFGSLTVDVVHEDETDAFAKRPVWDDLSVTPEGGGD